MKATTQEQKEVVRLRKLLPALSLAQLNWVAGQDYEWAQKEYAKTKKMVSTYNYFSVVNCVKGWQVVRYLLAHSTTTRNGYKFGFISEISERWMRANQYGIQSLVIFEKQKTMCWQWKAHPYALDSPLSLKPWSTDYNRSGRTMFHMADCEVLRNRRFSKEFKESGLAKAVGRVDEICLYKNRNDANEIKHQRLGQKGLQTLTKRCYLPNMVETLFKIGEPSLAYMMLHHDGWYAQLLNKYWHSFLIARRNGLKNTDWILWLDYVRDLEAVGKDIHSPKYLVPSDIGTAHAKIVAKIQAERERMRTERERKEALAQEESYKQRMQKYFGILIVTKSGLTITPLQSVQSFLEEGNAMHHCVYTCGYYKEDRHCVVLSAKDGDGKRVETIRVDLDSMSVAESRGVCNKSTPFHDEIVRAMEDNMWMIEDIANPTANRVKIAC